MKQRIERHGKQVGEWTTYDAKGKVVKVTKMKSPPDLKRLPSVSVNPKIYKLKTLLVKCAAAVTFIS